MTNFTDKLILLDDTKNFYKGNMHCHSTLSDGTLTPYELKEKYKKHGYSFIAYTDHDCVHSHTDLCDDEFIAITSCEISIKEFPNQSTMVNKLMKVCHLNLYAIDQNNEYNVYYSTSADKYSSNEDKARLVKQYGDHTRLYSAESINNIIRDANKHGFFVCYNHPRWSLENYSHYSKYKGLWGVEVYNHDCTMEGIYEYDINVYDDILRTGKRIFPSCGDDNHNKSNITDDSFGAFVMVNADTLSYSSIINGLLNGNFYSSLGPKIHSLYVQNGYVYIKCSDAEHITYSTAGRNSKAVHASNSSVNCAEFKIDPNDIYFRIDVIDKSGKRANTAAYFIEDMSDYLNNR